MKNLLETKLKIDQKIYIVYGNPANQTILSGIVYGIAINRKQTYFTYDHIKLVKSKKKLNKAFSDELIQFGSVDNEFIDMKSGKPTNMYAMHNWPVFTSKETCINYLRRFKND